MNEKFASVVHFPLDALIVINFTIAGYSEDTTPSIVEKSSKRTESSASEIA